MTTMRSASRTLDSRCAITIEVRPTKAVASACWTACSDWIHRVTFGLWLDRYC
jgi:hypothetical protein